MELMIALGIGIVFSFALRNVIKAVPVLFYVLAITIAFLFASNYLMPLWPGLVRAIYPYLQKSLLAFALFTVVMFIGVLPEGSRARTYLSPIRKELSIIAALLVLGHVANYLNSYFAQFIVGFTGMSPSVFVSFVVSVVLMSLLTILTITSFDLVRKQMSGKNWKRIQKLAYPFFLLVYLHLMLILLPSAMLAGGSAFVRIAIYTVVFSLYVTLRAIKWKRDKNLSSRNERHIEQGANTSRCEQPQELCA